MMRIGSLFSGAGGLDMAVEAVFNATTIWQAELAPAPCKVLAHRWPDAPNLGDITKVDWAALRDQPGPDGLTLADIDILCGGFPCQDVSSAGRRAGIKDGTRSGLWSIFANAIEELRPPFVVIENVRGLLSALAHRTNPDDDESEVGDADADGTGDLESGPDAVGDRPGRPVLRAIGAVLGDLSDLGYDAQWCTISAASVGAPHRRDRVFILATDAHSDSLGLQWGAAGGDGARPGDPGATAGRGGRERPQELDHPADAALLPSPCVNDMGADKTIEWWEQWTAKMAAKHGGIGHGNSLTIEIGKLERDGLLPTPTALHGPPLHKGGNLTLSGAVEGVDPNSAARLGLVNMLPTPTASQDSTFRNGAPSLGTVIEQAVCGLVNMLPTPTAWDGNDYVKTPEQQARQAERGWGTNLGEVIENEIVAKSYKRPDKRNKINPAQSALIIDTPPANDRLMLGGGNITWGKYEPAIRRWEALTRPAPAATEPNKNGKPKLAGAFSEWLMGWPQGWVTDTPGVTRNDALKIAGNGVCPQQAAAALRQLLRIAALTDPERW